MSQGSTARRAAADVQESTAMHGLARAGFFANGLIHILIGGLAFGIAFGERAEASHEGALEQLAIGPIGGPLLWATVTGLWGLALYHVLTAALIRGTDKDAWLARSKPAGRALAYLVVGAVAFRFVTGNAPSGSEAQSVSAGLLSHPGGVFAVGLIGLGLLVGGASFVAIGFRQRFLDDIRAPNDAVRRIARVFGVIGYVAKGIAIATAGVLFLAAAITADPDEAGGLDGALESLRRLPLGNVLLSIIALGFILFGLYCFIRAWYERLDRPARSRR
jgi:hypothetical protein